MQKVIISTDVGGIGKLINNDYNGYLIDVGDSVALANNINTLVNDKDKIVFMGNNLYNNVESNFSTRIMAENHMQIYKEILSKWR